MVVFFLSSSNLSRHRSAICSLSGPLKILKQCSQAACSLHFSLGGVESSYLPFATELSRLLACWVTCDKDTDVLGILKLEHALVRTSVCGESRFEHDLETWLPPGN